MTAVLAFHGFYVPRCDDSWWNCRDAGVRLTVQTNVRPDGSRVTVLVNIAPLFDDSGTQVPMAPHDA
jgi:hypothetical protein